MLAEPRVDSGHARVARYPESNMENLKPGSSASSTPPATLSNPPPKRVIPRSAPLPAAGRSSISPGTRTSARLLCLATLASIAAAGTWVVAAAVTAGQGLDPTDEGFYLLSYRWWDTDFRTFTGAQFVYGPVFELLGHNIASLRLVRLLTILGANVAFGWTFMRWLRLRRPNAAATRWWEAAGTAAIVACGGMNYSWLPLSPGYNDVSLLGALLAAAVVLKMSAYVSEGLTIPFWVPLSLGPVAFAMLLAKWSSSGLTLLVVALVAVVVLAPIGPRQLARVVTLALVGLVFSIVAVQLFIVPLNQAIPLMVATNKLVAVGTNNPSNLLEMYRLAVGDLITRTALAHGLLLISAVAAVALRTKRTSRIVAVLGITTAVLSLWILFTASAFTGGATNIRTYSVGLTLVLLVTLIVALGTLLDRRRSFNKTSSLRREGLPGAAVVVMLLALPVTQAAGTGNPIYFMAGNCFSAWAALIILVLTGIEGAPRVARALTAATAAGAVVLASAIGTTALLLHPYRANSPRVSTAHPSEVPALRSVRLEPNTARAYSQLRRDLEPYLIPGGGTYMMGFDGLAGVIFALDGRSVGEAWYSGRGRQRAAAGIAAECPDGKGPWGSRPPILVFNREISSTEIGALKACGLNFARDYQQLINSTQTPAYRIYSTNTPKFRIYVGTAQLAANGKGTP